MKHIFLYAALVIGPISLGGTAMAGPTLAPILTIDNPEPATGDSFGFSGDLSEDYLVIGALTDDASGFDSGRAYVYDARTGALLHTLANPDPTSIDVFGNAVSIEGDTVLLGAYGSDATFGESGRAYSFDLTNGTLLRTYDNPVDGSGGEFGFDLELDGGRALIGSRNENVGDALLQGAAHLVDVATGAVLQRFDDPTPTDIDNFARAVALHDNLALFGAPGDDTAADAAGQAHLFDVTTGELLFTFNDPTPGQSEQFGIDVKLGNGFALISANRDVVEGGSQGRTYLFNTQTGELLRTFEDPSPEISDTFGTELAVDGDFILISNTTDNGTGINSGQVHLFRASTGELLHTFDNPSPADGDGFGRALAISGNTVLIGSGFDDSTGRDSGQAYLYDISSVTGAAAVPIPASLAFLGLGVIGLGAMRRRQCADC